MSYGIRLEVWGTYACFTRPEMKVERVSYDVITPSAARAILEAIYWKPQIRWHVRRLHVLAPIQFTNIRRNEVASKISVRTAATAMKAGSGDLCMYVDDRTERQQRAALVLKDVRYGIEADFEILDPRFEKGGPALNANDVAGKHLDMFRRRAAAGQYFHHPYLGCREFAADFSLVENEFSAPSPFLGQPEKELGYMLHDIDFTRDRTPRFFRATMRDGVIDVPSFNTARA
jgi:CRISPR-associated protein Cas5d